MTTIVYSKGTLAWDSRISCDGLIVSEKYRKDTRLKDGSIAVFCGTVTRGEYFIDTLSRGRPEPVQLGEDTQVVHMTPSRLILWDGTGRMDLDLKENHTFGSGRELALGALSSGMEPDQAVSVASTYDTMTGGMVHKIHQMNLQRVGWFERALRKVLNLWDGGTS